MPNKSMTHDKKLRILAKSIRYCFNVEGIPLTIYNFADYQDLLLNTCGAEATDAIYQLLCHENV